MTAPISCFAYKRGVCNVLDVDCCTEPCSFCKTAAEHEAGRAKAEARIANMTPERQTHIRAMYYRKG